MKRKISNDQILPNYFTILNFATDNWKPQNLPKLIGRNVICPNYYISITFGSIITQKLSLPILFG